MAKVFVKDLVIGEEIKDQLFRLKEVGDAKNGKVRCILSDKTGECLADINEDKCTADFRALEGNAVQLTAVIINDGCKPLAVITKWEPADTFKPVELFQGISKEVSEICKKDIRENLIPLVSHAGYHALLVAALTDDTLDRMSELPVTLSCYGRYAGAALVATDAVTRMVAGAMSSYAKRGNGLCTKPPVWNVLLTASLLQHLGRQYFFDAEVPFKRSARGVALSYFSTLQMAIERVIAENEVPLSDQELANLLNILNVSVSSKTEVRAISKEGPILRHMIALYSECDAIDWEESSHEKKEGETYYWSKSLNRWVMGVNDYES